MTDDQFWMLIGSTLRYKADPDRQIAALRDALRPLSVDDVLAFEDAFGRQMRRSYAWALWGADYVVHGGASDDMFEYFRRWLISRGKGVFEQVLADPDSLADLLAPDPGGPLEFEMFSHATWDVWAEKTGKAPNEIPNGGMWEANQGEPAGTPFDDSEAYLASHYPRLWRRFGSNPLSGEW